MVVKETTPERFETKRGSKLAISADGDKELAAYLADLDELNPWRLYKIIAGSIASLFEHEIKIERASHVRTAQIRGCPAPVLLIPDCDVCLQHEIIMKTVLKLGTEDRLICSIGLALGA